MTNALVFVTPGRFRGSPVSFEDASPITYPIVSLEVGGSLLLYSTAAHAPPDDPRDARPLGELPDFVIPRAATGIIPRCRKIR